MNFARKRFTDIKPELRAKWPGRALDEGFVPFPKRLIRVLTQFGDATLIQELTVLLAVVDYNRERLEAGPSLQLLAFNSGLDELVVAGCLDRMRQKNWIQIDYEGDRLRIRIDGFVAELERMTENT